MEKTLIKIVPAILIALVLTGCSGYNKLLKSKDNELKYTKALEYFEAGKYQKTTQLLEDVQYFFRGTMKDDSVAYYLATAYYKQGDFESSALYLDEFRKTFTNSPFLEDAEYMYALGFYYLSPEANRDQLPTQQALIAIDEYLSRYPESVKKEFLEECVEELVQKLHDKVYINAKSYYTTRRYKAAVVALKNALNKYPESTHREEILYLIVKSNFLLAENSHEYLQRDRYVDMLDSYLNFISEYPESKYGKELVKMQDSARVFMAQFQETDGTELPAEEQTAE